MNGSCDVGIYGLATMGVNLARNAARHGFRVAVDNRHAERTDKLLERFGHEGNFTAVHEFPPLWRRSFSPARWCWWWRRGPRSTISSMSSSRCSSLATLSSTPAMRCSPTRNVVPGRAAARGIHFLGMGMSGGEKGALHGPSLMPGGSREAYDHLAPMLDRLAAKVGGESCCAYVGPAGSGHYAKMVHNGIEYADMQAMAEIYDLLRTSYGLAAAEIADVPEGCRGGELDSFLLDTAVGVLRHAAEDGTPLVDRVIDEAEQKEQR